MSKTTKAELREQLVNAAARNRRLVAASERCVRNERAAHEALRQAKAERDEAIAVAPAMAQLATELVAAVRRAEAAESRARKAEGRAEAADDAARAEQWRRCAEEAGRDLDRAVELLRDVAAIDAHAGWWRRRDELLREFS